MISSPSKSIVNVTIDNSDRYELTVVNWIFVTKTF